MQIMDSDHCGGVAQHFQRGPSSAALFSGKIFGERESSFDVMWGAFIGWRASQVVTLDISPGGRIPPTQHRRGK